MNTGRLVAVLAAVLATTTVVAAGSAAPDSKPPRILSAVLEDADGNFKADRLRLTYSEPIRHARDADGKYPFAVAGQRIRLVSAASGRTVVVALVEPAAAETRASTVRYTRTRLQPVRDRAGNQAVRQTAAVRSRVATPPPPAPGDRDGDGAIDPQDCAPTDPAVKPGAPDAPDLAFLDANCDGIDGNEGNAIFVSPLGKDTNPGTKAAPKRQIAAAVATAKTAGKDVYAAAGTYGHVTAASGVDVYGGYSPDTWKRAPAPATTIDAVREGLLADGAVQVTLQLLVISGRSTGASATSVYGIRAINGSKLTLQRVTVGAGNAPSGSAGANGKAGAPGGNGAHGQGGTCDVGGFNSPKSIIPGGDGAFGRNGGFGGAGGREDENGDPGTAGKIGTPGGAGGAWGSRGKPGQNGQPGASGETGAAGVGGSSSITRAGQEWRGIEGSIGQYGTLGMGGGGGGGGGGQSGVFVSDGVGNDGGGGGGAGGIGSPGAGGGYGGGSFGIYLHNSTLNAQAGTVRAGNGGSGGAGGRGGLGGRGGFGGGGAARCTDEIGRGGNGGAGGAGGTGGGGGGGAGGPSVGVMKAGTSTAMLSGVSIQIGTPGSGGASGGGAGSSPAAQPGIARTVAP